MTRTIGVGACAAVLVALAAVAPARAAISETPHRTWVTNGRLTTIVPAGSVTYIAGYFDRVGPRTGGGVGVSAASGAVGSWPEVTGVVAAVAPDGSGGWFIGGGFSSVGGVPRHGLAHVRADGSVDPAWHPDVTGTVRALAVSGSSVYVGGEFTSLGGQPRNNVGEVTVGAGAVTPWNPNATGPATPGAFYTVSALAVAGTTVYVGGAFATVGGLPRANLAAVSTVDGTPLAWSPNPTNGPYAPASVNAIAVSPTTVYAGGNFSAVAGASRSNIAAIDRTDGTATAWDAGTSGYPDSYVSALALSGSTIYVAGGFDRIGSDAAFRNRIAQLNLGDATATAWNPDAGQGSVSALAVDGGIVYAGGEFTTIGGQPRSNVAALRADTGAATAWNPDANKRVIALGAAGATVYLGGLFGSVGGVVRHNVAAIRTSDGAATAWNPDADRGVEALASAGGTIYLGGEFTSIHGQARNRIAAVDADDGAPTAWNPGADAPVTTFVLDGATLYAGGSFAAIGGQSRVGLAALSTADASVRPFNAGANGTVWTIARAGSTLYAAGSFSKIGGQNRQFLAALNISDASATPWNPNPAGAVYTLALADTTAYIGGEFIVVGGQVRNRIAEVNLTDGKPTAWNPGASLWVKSLVVSGATVYAGGSFSTIGGQPRNQLAALSRRDGKPTAWNPAGFVDVDTLALTPAALYVGGEFDTIGGAPQSHYAVFDGSADRTLSVAPAGSGAGTIASAPAGIACGASCSQAFQEGDTVTLTATPAAGSTFAGWSGGGCSGTGACTIALTSDTAVTATFTRLAAGTPPPPPPGPPPSQAIASALRTGMTHAASLRTLRSRSSAVLHFDLPVAGTLSVAWYGPKSRLVARASKRVAGARVAVRMRFTTTGKRLIRRAGRRLALTARASFTANRQSTPTTVTKTFTLRR